MKKLFPLAFVSVLVLAVVFLFVYNNGDRKYQREVAKLAKERARIEKEIQTVQADFDFVYNKLYSEPGQVRPEFIDNSKKNVFELIQGTKNLYIPSYDSLFSLLKMHRSRLDSLRNLLRSYPPPEAPE